MAAKVKHKNSTYLASTVQERSPEEAILVDDICAALGPLDLKRAVVELKQQNAELCRKHDELQKMLDAARAEGQLANERSNLLLSLYTTAPQLTDKELFAFALDKAVQLTASRIGFLHLISEDQKEIILTKWNSEALLGCTTPQEDHYPFAQAGNWCDSARLKQPIVYNDFPISPNQKGLPAGHAPLHRFMSIPVVEDDKVRIIFGVGNKVEEYVDNDIVQLQLIANELHKIVKQRHLANQSQEVTKAAEFAHEKAQAERDKLLKELEDLYNNAPCGYHSLDASGVFLHINNTELGWLGYTRDEVIGRMNMTHFLAPECVSSVLQHFPKLKESGSLRDVQLSLKRKDGTSFPVLLTATAVKDADGRFIMSRSTLFDMTEKMNAEREKAEMQDQLIQVDKLSSLGELAASVTHELKQPLNAIKIVGQSLLRDIEKNRFDMGSLSANLSKVVGEVNRMSEIIDHMRIYSRKTAGDVKQKIKANSIVESVSAFYQRQFRENNIQFHKSLAADLPCFSHVSVQVEQVLMNLIGNAQHALIDSGKETKHLDIVTYGISAEKSPLAQETVCIDVIDNGLGVPQALEGKIFQSFFTTKGPEKGTGLGLSISVKIIKSGGGDLLLENRPGEGATFRILLPVAV